MICGVDVLWLICSRITRNSCRWCIQLLRHHIPCKIGWTTINQSQVMRSVCGDVKSGSGDRGHIRSVYGHKVVGILACGDLADWLGFWREGRIGYSSLNSPICWRPGLEKYRNRLGEGETKWREKILWTRDTQRVKLKIQDLSSCPPSDV